MKSRIESRLAVAFVITFFIACDDGATDAPAPDPNAICDAREFGGTGEWQHPVEAEAAAESGEPRHGAREPVINPGDPFEIGGRFAYGTFSVELENERVATWLRAGGCDAWREVGAAETDADGRMSVVVDGDAVPGLGGWPFRMVVDGDGTEAAGRVWLVEPGQPAVVFDIDGTLTQSDAELGSADGPAMYAGANTVARAWADAGWQVVYLTGRPYFTGTETREWLREHDFPPGPLRTTDAIEQSLPLRTAVGAYKLEYLRDLIERAGLDIRYAYGNAVTDICAYADAGIDPTRTFIIGDHAGEACDDRSPTVPIDDYASHLTAFTVPGGR